MKLALGVIQKPTTEELYPLSLENISNRTTADCILLGFDAAPLGS